MRFVDILSIHNCPCHSGFTMKSSASPARDRDVKRPKLNKNTPDLFFMQNASGKPYTCNRMPFCGCHGFTVQSDDMILCHEKEHFRRIAWCIQNGYTPAQENVHLAPGDDSKFVYGVPPWNEDGTPNPQGVYFSSTSEMRKFEDNFITEQKKAQNAGWHCTSCSTWVSAIPREYKNGNEPYDWRWCMTCKTTKTKPPQKERAIKEMAQSIHKITKSFKAHSKQPAAAL